MKLTIEEKKIKLAEACGVVPVLERWCAYKDDGDGDSICMSGETRQEVENWLAALPEGSWAKEYQPKALYRYPAYDTDLNATHEAEKITLIGPFSGPENETAAGSERLCLQLEAFEKLIKSACLGIGSPWHATAAQRFEALGQALRLWRKGQ